MQRKLTIGLVALAAALGIHALTPVSAPEGTPWPTIERAEAGVKDGPGGGSGGPADRAGDRAADLIAGWVGPLLLVLIGVFALVALSQRNVSFAVSVAVIGLISGLFVFSPDSAKGFFEGVYRSIF